MTQNSERTVVELELTNKCNFKCIFCPREPFSKNIHYFDLNAYDKIVERVLESGIGFLKLCGLGEPTLHPDFMDFLENSKGKIALTLTTNASTLHLFDIDYLLENIYEFVISLHSLKKDTFEKITGVNQFDRVKANIDYLLEKNRKYNRIIDFYTVVTSINKDEIHLFKEYENRVNHIISGCSNRAINGFADHVIDDGSNKKYNRFSYIDSFNPVCGYAKAYSVIDSKGNYLVCSNDIFRRHVVGNIFENTIEEIQKKIIGMFYNHQNVELCRYCDIYTKHNN